MKNTFSIIVLIVGLTAVPLTAQEAVTRAVEEVAQDAPTMIDDIPSDVPAVIVVDIPDEPVDLTREAPVPKRYGMMRPTQADYPAAAWAADHEGRVRYEVAVDAQGRPTACEVTESSGRADLDKVTCDIALERGDFRAQVDENGESIAGVYKASHHWRKRKQEFPGTFKFAVSFLLDEKGEASDCQIIALEGEVPDDLKRNMERKPCPLAGSRSRGPYRDENGVPIAKRITFELAIEVENPQIKAEDGLQED